MKNRIEFYDIAKGILMCLVVLGHIITMNYLGSAMLKSFIYTFHVPAFFIITGMLLRVSLTEECKFLLFIKKRFKVLIVPYFLFEAIAAISQMIFLGTEYINIKGAIIGTFFIYCNGGATWFLPTLFIAEVMYYGIMKIDGKIGMRVSLPIIVFLFVSSFFFPKTHIFIVIARCFLGVGFIWIGMFVMKRVLSKCVANKCVCLIAWLGMAIITIVVTVTNGKVGMNLCEFNNPVLYIIGSLSGTSLILISSQFIHSKILQYIGINSLIIMGTHLNIIIIIEKLLHLQELKIDLWIAVLFVVILFEYLFVTIYNKIKYYRGLFD